MPTKMHFRFRRTTLVLVFMAPVAVAQAAARLSFASLERRNEEDSPCSMEKNSLIYGNLVEGRFQHDLGYTPSDQGFWAHFYGNKELVNGTPVYKFHTGASVIEPYNLRQAVADFGGFHTQSTPSAVDERVATISRDSHNEGLFVVKEGDLSVIKQLNPRLGLELFAQIHLSLPTLFSDVAPCTC
ncbi:uncharacterized protein UTRI_04541 [Ustilago trichophora]|uniref:Uncharacterized protein n=1 Tax=Ustilago trichophora TaxID=86804 RepID=A0A5C3EDI5_9BASI|nr:uncharacterized protein UTRI_04541 [Ustilago trichophora]